MKLTILFIVVVGASLVWWLRSVKPNRRVWSCGDAVVSICFDFDVCKGLLETVPATGSNCKNRDYRRVCYPNGSTPRMWGIGNPSTPCLSRC